MKNKFKRALNRELQSVHVSSDLKRRILQEAERTRFQAERRRSFAPFLSAAAAIVVILGLSLGVVSLRASAPKQHQTTLAQGDGDYVWIQSEDTIYHQDIHCGGMSGAIRVKIENAKASGRTPCAVCVSGTSVSPETTSGVMPTPVEWAESTPEPTVAPTVENVSLYTPTPEPFREAEVSATVQWATSTPEPTVAPTMVISHSYTPVPETFEEVTDMSIVSTRGPEVEYTINGEEEDRNSAGIGMEELSPTEIPFEMVAHLRADCEQYAANDVIVESKENAEECGLALCSMCFEENSETAVNVYTLSDDKVWMGSDDYCYHATEYCPRLKNAKVLETVGREFAEKHGWDPCETCCGIESTGGYAFVEISTYSFDNHLLVQVRNNCVYSAESYDEDIGEQQALSEEVRKEINDLTSSFLSKSVAEAFCDAYEAGAVSSLVVMNVRSTLDDLPNANLDQWENKLQSVFVFEWENEDLENNSCVYLISFPEEMRDATFSEMANTDLSLNELHLQFSASMNIVDIGEDGTVLHVLSRPIEVDDESLYMFGGEKMWTQTSKEGLTSDVGISVNPDSVWSNAFEVEEGVQITNAYVDGQCFVIVDQEENTAQEIEIFGLDNETIREAVFDWSDSEGTHKAFIISDYESLDKIEYCIVIDGRAYDFSFFDGAYWAASGGKYFHTQMHCQNMNGADPYTQNQLAQLDREVCPLCVDHLYYTTDEDPYYHADPHCQKMKNATLKSIDELTGKKPCSECMW